MFCDTFIQANLSNISNPGLFVGHGKPAPAQRFVLLAQQCFGPTYELLLFGAGVLAV